ncbi:hypothetical protein L6452_21304 [Arctium lappa]|uniref:Uncharacterized protein n=1 Tax=Arctium lappa TaxID=4217 RepID=A0ACB9BE85_ARCLA|nr:hypothetical protein L6452_21304 [Arctium lappa]
MGVPRKVRKFTTCSSNCRIGQEEKRRICKPDHRQPNTIIGSLPRDLLVDVLSRVASSSFTDLFNAKLCCKDYLEAAEDEYILQHISMDKFPIVYWVPPDDESLSFLTRCILKGNPEAIFRRGMMEYFSLTRAESGIDYLKTAAKKGHPEATYAYCMILLSEGDQSVLNLLNSRWYQELKVFARIVNGVA